MRYQLASLERGAPIHLVQATFGPRLGCHYQPVPPRASEPGPARSSSVAVSREFGRKRAKLPRKAVQNPTFVAFSPSKSALSERWCGADPGRERRFEGAPNVPIRRCTTNGK